MRVTNDLKGLLRRKLNDRKSQLAQAWLDIQNKKHATALKKHKALLKKEGEIKKQIKTIERDIEECYTNTKDYGRAVKVNCDSEIRLYNDNYPPKELKLFDVQEELYKIIDLITLGSTDESVMAKVFKMIEELGK